MARFARQTKTRRFSLILSCILQNVDFVVMPLSNPDATSEQHRPDSSSDEADGAI